MNPELRMIYNALPSGSTLPYDRFSQLAQHPFLSLLPYTGRDVISRRNDHITINSPGTVSHRLDKSTMQLGSIIEFDFNPSSPDVEMKNIKGIQVSHGRSPKMYLNELTFSKLANGNIKLVAMLQLYKWLPPMAMEMILTPDGKVI